MAIRRVAAELAEPVRRFVRTGFKPHLGELAGSFPTHPLWGRLRQLGSELWLDTGSLEEAGPLWTREFSALTTNNTLLNREVQTGRYDARIREAAALLDGYPDLGARERTLELAFILNACQVRGLAGIDVMTLPPKVAKGLLDLGVEPDGLADRTREDYRPPLAAGHGRRPLPYRQRLNQGKFSRRRNGDGLACVGSPRYGLFGIGFSGTGTFGAARP